MVAIKRRHPIFYLASPVHLMPTPKQDENVEATIFLKAPGARESFRYKIFRNDFVKTG